MSEENKYKCCLFACFFCVLLCVITLISTTLTITELTVENGKLEKKIENNAEITKKIIEENKKQFDLQNKTITSYKQYVDHISRCIIDGEW